MCVSTCQRLELGRYDLFQGYLGLPLCSHVEKGSLNLTIVNEAPTSEVTSHWHSGVEISFKIDSSKNK